MYKTLEFTLKCYTSFLISSCQLLIFKPYTPKQGLNSPIQKFAKITVYKGHISKGQTDSKK